MRNGDGSLPSELRHVPQEVLEEYVLDRFKQFAISFAAELAPGATDHQLELAFSRALYFLGAQQANAVPQLQLKFRHTCRFLGCSNKDCHLCMNNPNKTCGEFDNFDACYADNQVLKAKCDADIFVELVNKATGEAYQQPGVEIQFSVIDGERYNDTAPQGALSTVKELLKSDEGVPLLGCYGNAKALPDGHLTVSMQNAAARLPEVYVTDKNDTFHCDGDSYNTFRLMATAVRRDEYGNPVPVEAIAPAVSAKFVVKTQRALNDYRKSEYPHYKDELTRLRYIGSITAQRLKDVKQFLGRDVPFVCVETVEELKKLMEFADTNRQCETRLLELLNMKGKHKHKWDYLREVLAERIVYDDNLPRLWYADPSARGLLFSCKQAQVNLDKPAGVVQRVMSGQTGRIQVVAVADVNQNPQARDWRKAAEYHWKQPNHPGWQIMNEPLEYVSGTPQNVVLPSQPAKAHQSQSPRISSSGVGAGASAGGVSSPHMLPGYNAKGATAGAGGGDGLQAGKGYHRVSGDGDGGVSRARSNSLAGAPTQSQAGAGPDSYGLAGGYASDTATGHHMPHASQHHMTSHTITSGSSRDYSGLLPHDALHPPGAVRSMSQQMYPAMATVDGGFGVEQGGITTRHMSLEGTALQPFMMQRTGDAVDQALAAAELRADISANSNSSSSGVAKRGRNTPTPTAGHTDQAPTRTVLYHMESRGRHVPKIRTAEGDASQYNAPSHHDFGPVNSNGLDDFLSNFLAEPPHVERGKGGQAIKQNPDDVQGVLNLGDIPEGEPVSAGQLMQGFQDVLHIEGEENLQQQIAAEAFANRRLVHCDSDSFKRIIPDLGSPTGQGQSSLDAWLTDFQPKQTRFGNNPK